VQMVEEVEELIKVRNTKYEVRTKDEVVPRTSKIVLVHCWRGGMRSAGVAWLLDLYGFTVYTLVGGYKIYRRWVLQQFEKDYPLHLLGGYTGSGKTEVLHALRKAKQVIIDLEALASHKGSAFGNLGLPKQPSQEMFENLLAGELKVRKLDISDNCHLPSVIWLEDESQRIGEVNIPTVFFRQMRTKKLFFLQIPFEERLDFIVKHYGGFEKEKLINAIIRIKKRLGGLETKTAINFLLENDVKGCFGVLLTYYDKLYSKSLQQQRESFSALFNKLEVPAVADVANAARLLSVSREVAV
jgi:tRNA 2-selenouridine synthase